MRSRADSNLLSTLAMRIGVREKIGYVYTYGISMFKRGYINEGDLKDAVINKVAGRVGMDGPALDKWLEIPAVN